MDTLIAWLLEEDEPCVRYQALRDLRVTQAGPREITEARRQAHQGKRISGILAKMQPEGFWAKPGAGYSPKYQSSVWALILLAELGANKDEDERIGIAINYYQKHAFDRFGKISYSEGRQLTFDCLQGNMVWALQRLGMPRADLAEQIDWLASSQTGEGIAPAANKTAEKRYGVGKCGPNFLCTHNWDQTCAWGAIRVLMALGEIPNKERSETVQKAIALGREYLLQAEPLHPLWPGDRKISPAWHQLTFPLFYRSDILHLAEALTAIGAIDDPRAKPFVDYILSKRNPDGSWILQASQPNLGGSVGPIGKPNKWITLRALRVLQAAGRNA